MRIVLLDGLQFRTGVRYSSSATPRAVTILK